MPAQITPARKSARTDDRLSSLDQMEQHGNTRLESSRPGSAGKSRMRAFVRSGNRRASSRQSFMMKVKERTNEIMDDEKKIDLAMYSHSRQYGKGSDLIMRDDSMKSLSGIGKASSRLQRQHQFNTFNIAKAEVERSFDFRLMKAKDSAICQVFLLLCTCWALLALDLTYLYLDKGVDDVVQVITFIVFLVFCTEFSLQLYLDGDHFLFSTLAVLDILAILSMVIDIMPLFYEPERFSVENFGNGTLSETISVGSAELARAGRAAKSGSKMGRALRVVRIFRISKAFRSFYARQDHVANEAEHRVAEARQRWRRLRWVVTGVENFDNVIFDDRPSTKIVEHMSRKVSTIVLIMVFITLIMFPNLQFDSGSRGNMFEKSLRTVAVHRQYHATGDWTSGEWERALDAYTHAQDTGYDNGATPTPLLQLWFIEGGNLVEIVNHKEAAAALRSSPVDDVEWVVDDEFDAFAAINVRARWVEVSKYTLYLMLFVVVLLGFGSMYFRAQCESVTSLLVGPLQSLRVGMEKAMLMVTTFDLGNDVAQSDIAEVRDIYTAFTNMQAGLKSFGKYTPQQVVRTLIVRGEEATLDVNRRLLTIFFSDIEGFTTICESQKPHQTLKLLSAYFLEMDAILKATGGTLLEFIGDAILAIWNAPTPCLNHSVEGLRASLDMHKRLDQLRHGWVKNGFAEVRIRCGVHTGRVFVGNIGSPERMKYGVLGDSVNLASRLEETNKRYGTRTLTTGETIAEPGVSDNFVLRPVDCVVMKGRTEPTTLYECMARRSVRLMAGPKADTVAATCDNQQLQLLEDVARKQTSAYEKYRASDFKGAVEELKEVQALRPDTKDEATLILLERAQEFIATPPPQDWNGAEVLKDKHF